jgi:hypothetical protein
MTLTVHFADNGASVMEAVKAMANSANGVWSRFRWVMWGGAAFLLLLPLIAMQFTAEVDWDETDFIVMGAMLATACGIVELAIRASGEAAYRLGAIVAVGTGFLLVWINLAVGIIGSEDNPINFIYFAVLALAVVGSVIAGFDAAGLARALFATSAAQLAVTIVALVAGLGRWEPPGAVGILALNAFFAALWLLSGGLFRRSALKRAARA